MQSQSCAANSLYNLDRIQEQARNTIGVFWPPFFPPRERQLQKKRSGYRRAMLVAALLAAAAVANVIPSAESQWLHDSTLPLRGGVGHGVVEQVVTDCAETAARNAGAFKGQAQLAIIGCRPSLARFRMPFRTVEALDDGCYSASRQLLTIRLHQRRTCAVATSLRSQHRPRPWAYSCHPAGDAQLIENDEGGGEKCVLCNQEFHPLSADASSQSRSTAFRAQLRTCGHVFCSACVAQVLLPAALAHGNHASIVHLVTLHVLPWISDRPIMMVILACAYVALLWYAYQRLLAREKLEVDSTQGRQAAPNNSHSDAKED